MGPSKGTTCSSKLMLRYNYSTKTNKPIYGPSTRGETVITYESLTDTVFLLIFICHILIDSTRLTYTKEDQASV